MARAMAMSIAMVAVGFVATAAAQPSPPPSWPLWPDGAPVSAAAGPAPSARHRAPETVRDTYVANIHDPSLTVLQADARHANGAAVIIAPGGGHRMLVWQNEGLVAARALNRMGVTAFVLKYRLAREEGSTYTIEGDAAADLRRAVRWVRAHAAQFKVDPQRLGVMGFSAGGELVTLVADHAAPAPAGKADAIDGYSARPDFQVLVYPGPLGVPATAAGAAPPAFIVAGSNDKCCAPPALALYQQLLAAGVSAELHLYADTDHAFNMGQRSERLSDVHWPDRLADWLADGGWLVPGGGKAGVPAPAQ
ncbi:1,4-beta-xylanase [Duganella sp. Leaf126]|nr:1,4-beta-xylanase [Duganella sp. Leaf126]